MAERTVMARLARFRVFAGFVLGAIVLWLAQPTGQTVAIGAAVAGVGEAIRIWAAGHLQKSREVTASGPYRWFSHPLYLGSSVFYGLGIKGAQLSVVYPMVSLGNVWALVWSRWIFKEPLTRSKLIGLALILAGVCFVGMGN